MINILRFFTRTKSKITNPIYYIPETYDFLIKQLPKKKRPLLQPLLGFPKLLLIQTTSLCNAKCIFCPYGKTNEPLPKHTMDMDLFCKIVEEGSQKGAKRIAPYLMNEPLCDKELIEKIRYLDYLRRKQSLSFKTHINTNASLLTESLSSELIDSGLDLLKVSVNSLLPDVFNKIMYPLKLEKVLKNIDQFIELRNKRGKKSPVVRNKIVVNSMNREEIPEIIAYWEKREVKVTISSLNNRSSTEFIDIGIDVNKWEKRFFCNQPFDRLCVLANGDVVLCCSDWERKHVLGNVRFQSLEEIWKGNKLNEVRKKYLLNDHEGLLCKDCFDYDRN